MKLLGEWEEMKVDELGDEKREIGRDIALRSWCEEKLNGGVRGVRGGER